MWAPRAVVLYDGIGQYVQIGGVTPLWSWSFVRTTTGGSIFGGKGCVRLSRNVVHRSSLVREAITVESANFCAETLSRYVSSFFSNIPTITTSTLSVCGINGSLRRSIN